MDKEVVVNIRGNASDLKRELNDVANTPNANTWGRDINAPNRNPADVRPVSPEPVNNNRSDVTERGTNAAPSDTAPYRPMADEKRTSEIAPNVDEEMRSRGVPTSEEAIASVNREIQSRGVLLVPGSSTVTQIINSYANTQRKQIDKTITDKYAGRREDLKRRIDEAYSGVDEDIERQRQEGLANLGDRANDPFYVSVLNQRLEAARERGYQTVGRSFDEEEAGLLTEEQNERAQAEQELTRAIQELTEHFERASESEVPETEPILSRLRSEKIQAQREMEAATTPEELASAREKMADVNRRLRQSLYGDEIDESRLGGLGAARSLTAAGASLASGRVDLGDMVGGLGSASVFASGAKGTSFLKGMAVVELVKMVASTIQDHIKKNIEVVNNSSNITAQLSTFDEGSYKTIGNRTIGLFSNNPDRTFSDNNGNRMTIQASDLGLNMDELYPRMEKILRTPGAFSGRPDELYNKALYQIMTERGLGLEENALTRASTYDRYGADIVSVLQEMVKTLSGIEGSGISEGNYVLVQERLNTLQDLMQNRMSLTGRPDYETQLKTITAWSSIPGLEKDSRLGNYIKGFEDIIRNPQNDRMRVMIYDVISELFPETGGNTADIMRKLYDPKNMPAIQSAFASRWMNLYGDPETSDAGMFMYDAFLKPFLPYDQSSAVLRGLSSGESSKILTGETKSVESVSNFRNDTMFSYAKKATDLQSEANTILKSIENKIRETTSGVWGMGSYYAVPNSTKQ